MQAFQAFFPTLFQSRSVFFQNPGDLSRYLRDEETDEPLGLLDTNRIAADAKTYGKASAQYKLLEVSRTRPGELRELGFWPSEVYELSEHAGSYSEEHHNARLTQLTRKSRRTPLIHLCLLSMGVPNERYEKRIWKVIDSIVKKMSDFELRVLRLLVFAALFAPGIRIETSLAAHAAPDSSTQSPLSPSLAALVQTGVLAGSSRLHPVMSIPSPRLAMMLAKHEKVFGADGTEAPVSLARYVCCNPSGVGIIGELFEWVRASIEVRVMLEPLFVRAFCQMRIWHWIPKPRISMDGDQLLSFSFLVELLYACNLGLHKGIKAPEDAKADAKAAVAAVFESMAKLFSDVGYLQWTEDGDEAVHKDDNARRLDAAVLFSTHASRYIESYAFVLRTHDERTAQYNRAVQLLGFPGAIDKSEVLLRLATIDRRRLDSYFTQIKDEKRSDVKPKRQDLMEITDLFTQAKYKYIYLIGYVRKSFPHPLAGIAQLYLALLEHLKLRYQATSVADLLQRLDKAEQPGRDLSASIQTTAAGANVIEEIRDYIQEALYAAKYVTIAMDRNRTQKLTRTLHVRLHDLVGSNADAVDKATFYLGDRDRLRDSGSKTRRGREVPNRVEPMSFTDLCVHLKAVADHLSGRLKRTTVQLAPRVSLMHAVVEASTAIAARCTEQVPQVAPMFTDQVAAALLQNLPVDEKPLQGLVKAWVANTNHGLYPLLVTVMIQLYTVIFLQDTLADTLAMQDGLRHALENLRGEATVKKYQNIHTTRFFVAKQPALQDQPLSAFIAIAYNEKLQQAMAKGPGDQSIHSFWADVLKRHNVKQFCGQIHAGELTSTLFQGAIWFKKDFIRAKRGFEDLSKEATSEALPVTFFIGIADSGPVAYGIRAIQPAFGDSASSSGSECD